MDALLLMPGRHDKPAFKRDAITTSTTTTTTINDDNDNDNANNATRNQAKINTKSTRENTVLPGHTS